MASKEFTISEVRARLAGAQDSKQFWRSLDEVANTAAFQQLLAAELPQQMAASIAAATRNGTTRRDFLKLMGAALTMAGLTGCAPRQPRETIVPFVIPPEALVPGKPLFYATAILWGGYAVGVLAENHMGRPTKLEGNPLHPASLGGTNALVQGALLNLYDPDRAQVITRTGQINTWDNFLDEIGPRLEQLAANGGAGLHILTGHTTSSTIGRQMEAVAARLPQSVWHMYEPVNEDNVLAGTQLAFGERLQPVYDFSAAQRIVALDADFLHAQPGSIRYARDFIDQRRVWQAPEMNRLYVVECTPTITGAKADHRMALPSGMIEEVARALANAVEIDAPVEGGDTLTADQARWVEVAARDLRDHAGSSLVVAGESQPPVVHALAHAMNVALGNVGTTVRFIPPPGLIPGGEGASSQVASLQALTEAMAAGAVDTLVMINCNPVLTAPVEFAFADALQQVPLRVHAGLYFDETSALSHWHLPALHELESWSDGRAYAGTATILQPLIAPLVEGGSVHTLLAVLANSSMRDPYEIVRATWLDYHAALESPSEADSEQFWRRALHDGIVMDSAPAPVEVTLASDELPAPGTPGEGIELNFRPDPTVWDGQFANNTMLQELPKQLSLLTWDNALLLSPATAEAFGVTSDDMVEISFRDHLLDAAVWVMPGHADNAATLHLGYGRTWDDKVSRGFGFNAYALRTADAQWFGAGATLRVTGESYALASVQTHNTVAGRDLVRTATLEHFHAEPDFAQRHVHGASEDGELPSLFPAFEYEGNAWGMQIDLTACVGCNACTIACQIENNIPVVGKAGVQEGREMHWISVDRYFADELDAPESYFQPRTCMHCERAPCEPVCPVAATVHDHEGLNQMVYNRCVGTRYCSNNCPYKVRHFNYFDYTGEEIPLMALWRNPDVTVRSRGVMEKCTYCVQRINQARIEAEKESRPLRDGEIVTACQQACPTQAIVFGNSNDEESLVARQKQSPLHYVLLEELGTQPRTGYLAAVRNPHPDLAA